MFNQISEILKQFTSAQKMTALVVLLISIISISYIESVTKTPDELTKQVSIQREVILKDQKYIYELSFKINSLNDSIMFMNQSFNQKAIDREKIYAKKMLEQQQYVNSMIDEIKQMMASRGSIKAVYASSPILKMEYIHTDSMIREEPQENLKKVSLSGPVLSDNQKIIDKLNKIKRKVKERP